MLIFKTFVLSILDMRRHGWLLVLGTLCAVGPLSIDLYLPGAPAVALELGGGGRSVQFSVASYLIGLVVGQLFYGPFSDHIGRKPPLYIGLTLYTVSSATCVLVNDVSMFICLRFLQGLGGCVGMVIARAVVRDRADAIDAARAFSQLMLVVSVAPLLAPLLGAAILQYWGWRAMFGAMAIFGGLCLIAIRFTMQETHRVCGASGITGAGVLRIYLDLLQDRQFVAYTLCNGLAQGGMYAYIAGSAVVLINLYGIGPTQYSFIFIVNSLGMIVASQINVQLIAKMSIADIIAKALWLPAGLALIVFMMAGNPSIAVLLVGFFLFLSSIGFIAPNAAAIALSGHAEHAGAAAALMGTLLFGIGALCGVAVTVLHDGSVRPLMRVMAMCAIGAMLVHRFTARC